MEDADFPPDTQTLGANWTKRASREPSTGAPSPLPGHRDIVQKLFLDSAYYSRQPLCLSLFCVFAPKYLGLGAVVWARTWLPSSCRDEPQNASVRGPGEEVAWWEAYRSLGEGPWNVFSEQCCWAAETPAGSPGTSPPISWLIIHLLPPYPAATASLSGQQDPWGQLQGDNQIQPPSFPTPHLPSSVRVMRSQLVSRSQTSISCRLEAGRPSRRQWQDWRPAAAPCPLGSQCCP